MSEKEDLRISSTICKCCSDEYNDIPDCTCECHIANTSTKRKCLTCENILITNYSDHCAPCVEANTERNDKLRISNTERKGDQTPPCNVCKKPFKWENHYQVAVWNGDEWEVETFWAHIKCYALASYADHIKELGKARVTYQNGKAKFEILEGE